MKSFAFLFVSVFLLAACITHPPPIHEYTLARSAIESARSVEAVRFSPGFWHQAEESFRKARILYREKEYKAAKDEFDLARVAAEKAENSTRLIRMKNGEVL